MKSLKKLVFYSRIFSYEVIGTLNPHQKYINKGSTIWGKKTKYESKDIHSIQLWESAKSSGT